MTSAELINKAIEMGISEETAILIIDSTLDATRGYENRKDLDEEELTADEVKQFLDCFECTVEGEKEAKGE